MINGNANEFIDGLYYGDEREFLFKGVKYFIQGYYENGERLLVVFTIEPPSEGYIWTGRTKNGDYPVKEFEQAKIFEGKSFWEVEKDIEWVDE